MTVAAFSEFEASEFSRFLLGPKLDKYTLESHSGPSIRTAQNSPHALDVQNRLSPQVATKGGVDSPRRNILSGLIRFPVRPSFLVPE